MNSLFLGKRIRFWERYLGALSVAGARKKGVSMVKKNYKGRCKKRTLAKCKDVWGKMDEELLPAVKETICKLQEDGDERPQRITVNAVRRAMKLPDKRFDKLLACKAEIISHMESQKECRARECVWAYHVLVDIPISWRQIRNLTNMRNIDFINCKPFLVNFTDEVTAKTITELL